MLGIAHGPAGADLNACIGIVDAMQHVIERADALAVRFKICGECRQHLLKRQFDIFDPADGFGEYAADLMTRRRLIGRDRFFQVAE